MGWVRGGGCGQGKTCAGFRVGRESWINDNVGASRRRGRRRSRCRVSTWMHWPHISPGWVNHQLDVCWHCLLGGIQLPHSVLSELVRTSESSSNIQCCTHLSQLMIRIMSDFASDFSSQEGELMADTENTKRNAPCRFKIIKTSFFTRISHLDRQLLPMTTHTPPVWWCPNLWPEPSRKLKHGHVDDMMIFI